MTPIEKAVLGAYWKATYGDGSEPVFGELSPRDQAGVLKVSGQIEAALTGEFPDDGSGPKCKGCGRPIVWGMLDGGGRVPLDPRPPVYETTLMGEILHAYRKRSAMVIHFATCSAANTFSKGARRDRGAGVGGRSL